LAPPVCPPGCKAAFPRAPSLTDIIASDDTACLVAAQFMAPARMSARTKVRDRRVLSNHGRS
jgi:hypothetical protein